MWDEWSKMIKREMMEEAERIMEEVNADPALKDVEAPKELHDKLFAQIREYEERKRLAHFSEEEKELIQLGKVYKRKRKLKKSLILIAAVVVILALGNVCIGEDETLFKTISMKIFGEDRTTVDVGETETIIYNEEEKAYSEIEKKYGFTPVELEYLPANTGFYEAVFSEDMQYVNLIYEMGNGNSIVYMIRPNYRDASLGNIIEDEKIQEYKMYVGDTEIIVAEYNIEDTDEKIWSVNFVYQDVQYLLRVKNMEQAEIEKIINNLGFLKEEN